MLTSNKMNQKEATRLKRNTRIDCDCGGSYTVTNTLNHSRCQKHIYFLNTGLQKGIALPAGISRKNLPDLTDEEKIIKRAYQKKYRHRNDPVLPEPVIPCVICTEDDIDELLPFVKTGCRFRVVQIFDD